MNNINNAPYIIGLNPSDIITWCNKKKRQLGYSNAKLSELTGVPLGTVDRIMAGKYTEYRYSSIQPLISCLMDEESKSDINELMSNFELRINLLERDNRELNKTIDTLLQEREYLRKENNDKEKHINFLEEVINDLRKRI